MSRRTRIHLLSVAAAVVTAAAVAACGGSSSPPTSTTGQTTAASNAPSKNLGQAAFKFSACMRSHGVTNFPDPQVQQQRNRVSVIVDLPPGLKGAPAFRSAQKACNHYMPAPGPHPQSAAALAREKQAALAFARCVRDRGFPKFPDPTAQGQLTSQMVTNAGIDLHQPALLHAGLACVSVTHGLLTPADIRRAVNGGG